MLTLSIGLITTSFKTKLYAQKFYTQIYLFFYRYSYKFSASVVLMNCVTFYYKSKSRFYFMLLVVNRFFFRAEIPELKNKVFFLLRASSVITYSNFSSRQLIKYKIPVLRSPFIYKKSVEHFCVSYIKCLWFFRFSHMDAFTRLAFSRVMTVLNSYKNFSSKLTAPCSLKMWQRSHNWSIV